MNLGHIPVPEALTNDPACDEFRADGIAITGSAIGIVEWLRSRMPRYPIRFKLPYTDPFSSRVVDHGFPDPQWPWLLDARKAGFQHLPTVAPQVSRDLEVNQEEVRDALGALSSALAASPVWRRFAIAETALDANAETVLHQLVLTYRALARPEAVDLVEPRRVMRRMQHRHAAVRVADDAARESGGAVADYYAAFRALDRTLGDVVAVLSQFLIYGSPRIAPVHRASWRRHVEEGRLDVSFKTDGFLQRLNEVVRLQIGVAPLGGLVVVEGYNLSFHRLGDGWIEEVHVTGVVLPDSG